MRKIGYAVIAGFLVLATVAVGVSAFVFGDNLGRGVSGDITVNVDPTQNVDDYSMAFPETFKYREGTAFSSSYQEETGLLTVRDLGFLHAEALESYGDAFYVRAQFTYDSQTMLDYIQEITDYPETLRVNFTLSIDEGWDGVSEYLDFEGAAMFLIYDGSVNAAIGAAMKIPLGYSVSKEDGALGLGFYSMIFEGPEEYLSYQEFFTIGNGYGEQSLTMVFAIPLVADYSEGLTQENVSALRFSIGYGFHAYDGEEENV